MNYIKSRWDRVVYLLGRLNEVPPEHRVYWLSAAMIAMDDYEKAVDEWLPAESMEGS